MSGSLKRSSARRGGTARWVGAVAGLLSGVTALAASEATARAVTHTPSPFLAVADRAVDLAPRPVKDFAVSTFGTADKPLLIAGVLLTVLALVTVIGAVGVIRPRLATVALATLVAVATVAVATDRTSAASVWLRLVPAVVLGLVGLVVLNVLLSTLRPPPAADGTRPDRRSFLRLSAAAVVLAAVSGVVIRVYGGLAAAASRAGIRLPVPASPAPPVPAGTSLDVGGITPYLTPNATFYRVDTALRVPDVPAETWSLRVHGLVDRELSLSYHDLLSRPLTARRITLTCVSNPVGGHYLGNATWLGVPVATVLAEAGVQPGADAVKSTSADRWTAGTPLDYLTDPSRGALLALGMNGVPLPLEHGFPVRLVTPGLYGYVSATKWLTDLEVTRFADFAAYWTQRGYAARAPIKTSSRIDVPGPFARLRTGRNVVAGVAWSQGRGIEGVEVRVDGGPWEPAELATQDGVDTWRQWRWEWNASPGNHRLEVRATDGDGVTQTAVRTGVAPDGATGWHSVAVKVG